MEASSPNNNTQKSPNTNNKTDDEAQLKLLFDQQQIESLKQSLPKSNWLNSNVHLIKINNEFWYPIANFHSVLAFQRHFIARDTDLIVTSFPKTGTTWLKSLLFSVTNRSHYRSDQTPLLTNTWVKKLAQFVGVPFSSVEENEGVIEAIIELCSLKALKELDVNKSKSLSKYIENKEFFRDGEVGGWQRHLTAPMAERMNTLMEQKLESTGLSFKLLPE